MLGAGAIVEQNALRGAQMLIARATDTRVLDWRSVCAALWRGTPIELVVEEGFERAIGFRADLDGAFGAMGPGKGERCRDRLEISPRDGGAHQDLLAQRCSRRLDQARVTPVAPDRRARVSDGRRSPVS